MEVSVIVPTYNSARFLGEAINSVLAQTYRDFEVLVIDDGSTDDTQALMKSYGPPVRYIRQENQGVSVARNRGIEESRGRYVAFLDADDTWFPDKLERQLAAIESQTNHRVCYTAYTTVDSKLTSLGTVRSNRVGSALEDLLLRGNVVGSICTVLCERSLFELTGGFDTALSQCADWDMWVRLAAHTEFLYIDEPTVTYRQHGSNMSRMIHLLENDSLYLLKRGFEMPGLSERLRARRQAALARNYMVLAGSYFGVGQYWGFARCALRAITMDVNQVRYLLGYPERVVARSQSQQGIQTTQS